MTTAQDGGKVVSLTHRPPLPPGNTPGTHFCWRLSRPQSHSATGRIMSPKNSNDSIGNRIRDLPVCSVVPSPLRHRASPFCLYTAQIIIEKISVFFYLPHFHSVAPPKKIILKQKKFQRNLHPYTPHTTPSYATVRRIL